MPDQTFDLANWFNRIGYTGSRTPTLETLNSLVLAHSHAIAYESLDVLLGRPPKLDLASLQRKMIAGGRGGYCFEHNMLFRAGLRSLGFEIVSLQARVVRGLAIDAPRPAIHMVLRVELPEGPYLADVGYGNLAPTSALLMKPLTEQVTPHEAMRFIMIGDELTLQARFADQWEHIYRVIPHPRLDAEYEIANWYTGTNPDRPFMTNMIAARPAPNRTRLTMFNARVTVRHATGEVERRMLQTEDQYCRILRDEFGLNVTDEEVRAMLAVVEEKGERGPPHASFT
jgi:N-hydroxyarylamine O-acetyltransferase